MDGDSDNNNNKIAFNTRECVYLTLSCPVMPNGYTSKCSGPYWSNPLFLIFDIRAIWRSGLSARLPECQKIKNDGLDKYSAERDGRLIFDTMRKTCGAEIVN